jgi:prephenate dehydratase
VLDERVGDALAALKRVCADVRYLGSYPRRDGKLDAIAQGRTDADFTDAREWLTKLRTTGSS